MHNNYWILDCRTINLALGLFAFAGVITDRGGCGCPWPCQFPLVEQIAHLQNGISGLKEIGEYMIDYIEKISYEGISPALVPRPLAGL